MSSKNSLILLFFLLTFQSLFAQKVNRDKYKLLWEITGEKLSTPSYLFGTMHIRDERAFQLPDSLFFAIENTETIALEVMPDSVLSPLIKGMLDEQKQPSYLQQMPPKEREKISLEFYEKTGISIDSFVRQNELQLLNTEEHFDEPTYTEKRNMPLDLYLYRIAFFANSKIEGLENLSDYQQLNDTYLHKLVQHTMQNPNKAEGGREINDDDYEKFIKLYQKGTIEQLSHYNTSFFSNSDLYLEVLNKRNQKMAQKLEQLMLQTDGVFAAVGATHLSGNDGIIELLKAKGYSLRPVTPKFTGLADNYQEKQLRTREKTQGQVPGTNISVAFSAPFVPVDISDFNSTSVGFNVSMSMDLVELDGVLVMQFSLPAGVEMNVKMLKDLLKGFEGRFQKRSKIKTLPKQDGLIGIEQRQYDKEGHVYTMRAYGNDKQLLFLLYMNLYDKKSTVATQEFFDSFQLVELPPPPPPPPPALKEDDFVKFMEIPKGFSADFPAYPTIKTHYKEGLTSDTQEPMQLKVTQFSIANIEDDNFFIQHIQQPIGLTIDNDRIMLDNALNSLSQANEVIKEPKIIEKQGVLGAEIEVKTEKGYKLQSLLFQRGPHQYLVVYGNKKINEEKAEDFLGSFKFLPFQFEKLNRQQPEGKNFSILLPSLSQKENLTIDNDIIDNDYTLIAYDSISGVNYRVREQRFIPYYTYNSAQDWADATQKDIEDKGYVVSDKNEKDGRVRLFYEYKEQNSISKALFCSFLADEHYYELMAYIPDETGKQKAMEFFDSFELIDKSREGYLFKAPGVGLLDDISSDNEQAIDKAIRAINSYELSADNLPQIRRILNKKQYKRDTVEALLLREFTLLTDDASFDFLTDYFENKKTKDLFAQHIVLHGIHNCETKEARNRFFEYATNWERNNETLLNDYELIFKIYQDSLDLFVEQSDNLLDLVLNHEQFASSAATVFQHHARNTAEQRDLIVNYRDTLFQKVNQIAEKYKLFEDPDNSRDFREYDLFETLCIYLTDVPASPEIEEFFKKFESFNDPYLVLAAIRYYATEQIPLNQRMLRTVAESPYERTYLMSYAQDFFGSLDILPAEYNTQESAIEAYVHLSIREEYNALSAYKVLETRPYTYQDKEYKIFVYSFSIRGYEGEYLGMVSQPADGTVVPYPTLSNYNTIVWDGDNTEQLLKEITDYWEAED